MRFVSSTYNNPSDPYVRQSPLLVFGVEKLYKVKSLMLVVVRLFATGLKQGLHDGISELRLMWKSLRVQWMVEVGRRGRRRMRMMQGRRSREEISNVILSMIRPDFS